MEIPRNIPAIQPPELEYLQEPAKASDTDKAFKTTQQISAAAVVSKKPPVRASRTAVGPMSDSTPVEVINAVTESVEAVEPSAKVMPLTNLSSGV